MDVGELKIEMDHRFEQVDRRFEQVNQEFSAVRQEMAAGFSELKDFILAEGVRTRRHFDVVAEQMKTERNLAIDKALATEQQLFKLTASNTADHVEIERRLENHDRRLSDLEKR